MKLIRKTNKHKLGAKAKCRQFLVWLFSPNTTISITNFPTALKLFEFFHTACGEGKTLSLQSVTSCLELRKHDINCAFIWMFCLLSFIQNKHWPRFHWTYWLNTVEKGIFAVHSKRSQRSLNIAGACWWHVHCVIATLLWSSIKPSHNNMMLLQSTRCNSKEWDNKSI